MFDLGFTLIDEGGDGGATIMAEYGADLFDEVDRCGRWRSAGGRCSARSRPTPNVPIGAVEVLAAGELDDLVDRPQRAPTTDVPATGSGRVGVSAGCADTGRDGRGLRRTAS